MTEPIYAAAYPIYRDLGWAPIKLHARTKWPPPTGFTGHNGIDPSGADMHTWAEDEPDGNNAIRLSNEFIGIDTDDYDGKNGGATIAAAEKRWGKLPYSPRSSSRPDDPVSGIRLYRIPPGVELKDVIEFPELGLGGVEIIQHHHRFVVCWPSIHPEGRQYRWWGIDGTELPIPPAPGDIPDLPAAWLEGLRKPPHNGADLSGDNSNSAYTPNYDVRQALTQGEMSRRVAWKLGEAILACYGTSRHDHTRDNVLGLLRYGKQGDTGVLPALKALQKAFVAAIGPDRPGGHQQATEEFRDFVNSDRVAQLLAEPDHDDWMHNLEEPPDVNDHRPGEGGGEQGGGESQESGGGEHTPTTWEPVNLGPWLNGEAQTPETSLGLTRSDGLQLIYPAREHAFLGETESGKTWAAIGCVAAELTAGNHVVYIHYEEGNPASTVERLLLLGVDPDVIAAKLGFIAPSRPAHIDWITALLTPAPTLVVHDGVNEAMSLIGADIMAADGAATFRRRLITPFLRAGAASIACDHLPKDRDGRSRDAYGSVHKGNALDGARYVLENVEPFGRGMRGVSYLFVTKDRPGQLRSHGRPTKLPGKTFVGTLVVDDMTCGPEFFMRLFAPKDDDVDDQPAGLTMTPTELADAMYGVIAALPEHTAESARKLHAEMRKAGHKFRRSAYEDTADDLIAAGRVVEVPGRRGATGYRAVVTASQEESE